MTTPRPISDEALICFVRWCRLNDWRIVSDPTFARRVLEAYRRAGQAEPSKAGGHG